MKAEISASDRLLNHFTENDRTLMSANLRKYVCAYTKYEYVQLYYTVEPLYKGHVGTIILVLITEVSSIQRSFNTPQYYTGTQNGVFIIEVSTFQRFVIERFQCILLC